MPLTQSSSDKAFSRNVAEMVDAGHPRDQALAAAYRVKRTARAMGGPSMGPAPWYVRQEAHGMHTGPILSAVAGRTDRHNVNVPSGSYIFPADFVSHLGQNNTMAGMAVLNKMFGSQPFTGGQNMPMAHGAGAPRPPRAMAPTDSGGARGKGHQVGDPTPIVVAGGEYSASPEAIMRAVGTNDLDYAHKVLDHWVMSKRQEHIRVLRALPPPAKS